MFREYFLFFSKNVAFQIVVVVERGIDIFLVLRRRLLLVIHLIPTFNIHLIVIVKRLFEMRQEIFKNRRFD